MQHLVEPCLSVFLDGNFSLRPLAVGILKSLTSGNLCTSNCDKVFQKANEILQLASQTQHEGVRFESLRLVCNLIKYSSHAAALLQPKLLEMLFGEMLVCSKHPILQMDASLALNLLADCDKAKFQSIIPEGWQQQIDKALQDATKSVELDLMVNLFNLMLKLDYRLPNDCQTMTDIRALLLESERPQKCPPLLWQCSQEAFKLIIGE